MQINHLIQTCFLPPDGGHTLRTNKENSAQLICIQTWAFCRIIFAGKNGKIFNYVICIPNCYHQSKIWHFFFLYILLSNLPKYDFVAHIHIQKCLKVSKVMQKIAKSVQNYSKYHSQIFDGNYDKFAGNQFLPQIKGNEPIDKILTFETGWV